MSAFRTSILALVPTCIAAALALASAPAGAAPGGLLDPSFGLGGLTKLSASTSGDREFGDAMTIDPAGRILVGGHVTNSEPSDPNSGWTVARFRADGAPDDRFGTNGVARSVIWGPNVWGEVRAIEIVPGGTDIIVAGVSIGASSNSEFTVARLNDDGSLDMEFGPANTGFVRADLSSSLDDLDDIDVSADGSITAIGAAGIDAGFVRWDSDGALDPAFDGPGAPGNGKFADPLVGTPAEYRDLEVEPSGAIRAVGVVAGPNSDWLVGRYTSTGARDTAFGFGDGITIKDFIGQNEFATGQVLTRDALYVFGTTDTDPGPGPGEARTFAVSGLDPAGGAELPGTARTFPLPGDQNLVAAALQRLGGSTDPAAERFLLAGTGLVGSENGAVLMRLRREGGTSRTLELDPEFGTNGVVVTGPVGSYWGDVAVDGQNRAVVGGQLGLYEEADLAAARFVEGTPPQVTDAPRDTRRPRGSLALVSRSLSQILRQRSVVVRASMDEAGSYALVTSANRRRGSANGRRVSAGTAAAPRPLVLKRTATAFGAAGTKLIRLKLTRPALRALRGRPGARLTFRYEMRDRAGNEAAGRVVKALAAKRRAR